MPRPERITAVALLTAGEVARLGLGLDRIWPLDETPSFEGLLKAIDDAERCWREASTREGIEAIRPRQQG